MTLQELVILAESTSRRPHRFSGPEANDFNHRIVFSRVFQGTRNAYVATEQEARHLAQAARRYGYNAGTEYKRIDQNW